MSVTEPTLSSEWTYRHVYIGLLFLMGPLTAVTALAGGFPMAMSVFLLLALSAFGLRIQYTGPLFDERDKHMNGRIANLTLNVLAVGWSLIVLSLTVLNLLNIYSFPEWIIPVSYAAGVAIVVYIGTFVFVRYRS